jgi:hypothetical protein
MVASARLYIGSLYLISCPTLWTMDKCTRRSLIGTYSVMVECSASPFTYFPSRHYLRHAACRRPSNVTNSRVIHNQVCRPFCEPWSISCVLSHSAQYLASNRSSNNVQSPHFASPDGFHQDTPFANSAKAVFSIAHPHLAACYSWLWQDTTRYWI